MPPTYTAFGTVDETGLAVVDRIAAGGVKDGGDDGKPAVDVTIGSIRLD
jgi:peptidyl-prolyl cis-trans isomerase B (cyclophilin B)